MNSRPELVNHKVSLGVSEPFEFGTEHGTGPFTGRVSAVRGDTLVVALEAPLVFRGEKIIQLVATARHEGARLDAATLGEGTPVTFTPITELDIAEFGDVFKIAASRRRWFLGGDLVLAP